VLSALKDGSSTMVSALLLVINVILGTALLEDAYLAIMDMF